MVFKFVEVDSLDAVPPEFKAVYSTTANANGKFEVGESFKPFVTSYVGTNTALETERGKVINLSKENAQRRTAQKPFEDLVSELGITPEGEDIAGAIRAHVGSLTEKVKGGEAFKGDLKKIQEAAAQKVREIEAANTAKLTAMQATLNEHLIGNEAVARLAAVKAKNPAHVLPMVQSKLRVIQDEAGKYVVRAVDDQGQVRYNSAQQPMAVADVVDEFRQDPSNAYLFESVAASGIGTPPGGAKQPAARVGGDKGGKTSTQMIADGLTDMQNHR
jgi:hypothetical protein